jgi:hypothetical protein
MVPRIRIHTKMSWIRNTGFDDGSFEVPVVQRGMVQILGWFKLDDLVVDGLDGWVSKIAGWLRRVGWL